METLYLSLVEVEGGEDGEDKTQTSEAKLNKARHTVGEVRESVDEAEEIVGRLTEIYMSKDARS